MTLSDMTKDQWQFVILQKRFEYHTNKNQDKKSYYLHFTFTKNINAGFTKNIYKLIFCSDGSMSIV